MQPELSIDAVLTAFGMTECVVATMCRPGDPDDLVAGSCCRAVPGLELRIATPGTNDLGPGEEDELLLRGDTVMLGYLDDPLALQRPSIPRAGCVLVTPVGSTSRVTSRSPTGSRTCTSPVTSTSIQPRWCGVARLEQHQINFRVARVQ